MFEGPNKKQWHGVLSYILPYSTDLTFIPVAATEAQDVPLKLAYWAGRGKGYLLWAVPPRCGRPAVPGECQSLSGGGNHAPWAAVLLFQETSLL
ncbi:hypothetical protein FKM82_016504 [Ascaphus truei]